MNRELLIRRIFVIIILFLLLKFKINEAFGLIWYVIFFASLFFMYVGHKRLNGSSENIKNGINYDILDIQEYTKASGKVLFKFGIVLLTSFILIRLVSIVPILNVFTYALELLLVIVDSIIYIILNIYMMRYCYKNDIILMKKKR